MKATITIEGRTTTEFPNLVRNDFGSDVQFNLTNDDGTPYDLTGFTVKFKAALYGQTCGDIGTEVNQIDETCAVAAPLTGQTIWTIAAGNLATAGKYKTEVECVSGSITVSVKTGDLVVVDDNPV